MIWIFKSIVEIIVESEFIIYEIGIDAIFKFNNINFELASMKKIYLWNDSTFIKFSI